MEVLLNLQTVDEVVEEIMRIHRSLPTRPSIDEVEAARDLIRSIKKEDQSRLDAISRQTKGLDVPEELFMILQEMQRNFVYFQSKEQKREAAKLLDLEYAHALFDEYLQRASECLSSGTSSQKKTSGYSNGSASMPSSSPSRAFSLLSPSSSGVSVGASAKPLKGFSPGLYSSEREPLKNGEFVTRDDSYVKKAKSSFYVDGIRLGPSVPLVPHIQDSTLKSGSSLGQDGEKLSLIKVASLIEVSAKKGTEELNLQNRLMDQVDWLPDSIGKLSGLLQLDLSDNRLLALPASIGGLSSLTKLDLHCNRLSELPETVGDLLSLVFLDLSGNQIATLPSNLGRLIRLEELNLSSNRLVSLPDMIGSLVSLKILNIETNDMEELPHTIGQCSSLRELRADYNRLKALPEAVGKITTLEVLSVRYNNIRQLPTTMSSLGNLKELDMSFNELESVPESLCFATTLVRMNIGNNFADLRHLPRSIGNLEMLEELDISNNQIRVLPDSFRMLIRLRILRVEENPLEVPPRAIADKGAQAIVQYMAELVESRNKPQPMKQKKGWSQICFFSRSNKRSRRSMEYVKA
ncbi:hypothetical protein SAY87_013464 [Trapa incisa]|uniref:Disease resistance R13L4/SHOC-2-like LRR domain-containing protein n=1 Tax=Trapa incisa TaxID=236973 RepID=A0AAN7QCZ7_9MYRT|nr:hypothetical protein SAY87_013464 [Trapa incisa]